MAAYATFETMSENLQRLRKERHLSQPALAKRAGICENTIYAYESGRREGLLLHWLLLADALGVTLADLATPYDGGGGSIEEEADY